jgi:small subunit ribosomal protein S18
MDKNYEKNGKGGDRGGGERNGEGDDKRRGFARRKVCRFCADQKIVVDFKDQSTLKYFVTERGKIIPRRISGNCSKHQRAIARAVKQARGLALIPYLVLAS